MKKRLISLLVAVVMLAGMLPVMSVSAADMVLYSPLDGGWSVAFSGTPHESDKFVWTASGESYDSNNDKSLFCTWNGWNGSYATVYNDGLTSADVKAGTYHLSFYLKGKVTTLSALIGEDDSDHRKYFFNNEATEVSDWTQYSCDITVADGKTKAFCFIVEGDTPTEGGYANQFYIDNVVLTYGDDATNLLNNGDFAGYSVSAPTKTSDLYKWTATPKGGETTAIAKVAEGVSYSGNNSMYIKYEADDYGSKWMNIVNDEFATYDAGSYTLEFYAKGRYNHNESGGSINFGMGGTSWSLYAANKNTSVTKWKISHMTITDLDDSDPKKAEGWRKYTATFNGTFTSVFTITVQSGCELYIDDMSIKANNTGDNLFANPGFEEEKAWIGEVEDPAAESLSDVGAGWKVTADADSPLDGVTNMVKETTHFAYSGEKSLYVKYSPLNRDDNGDSLRIENLGLAQAEPDKKYRVSFYLKGDYAYKGEGYINDVAFNVALGWAMNDTRIRMSKQTPQTPEDAAKAEEGWEKYSFDINTEGKTQDKLISFSIFLMNDCEMYLDDFSVVEVINESTGTYSANLLTNSGFEGIKEYAVLGDLENWTVTPGKTGEISVKTATGVSYSGNKSMYVKTADGGNYTYVNNSAWATAKTDDTDKVYNIEFYAKGSFEKTEAAVDPFFVMVGWGWGWGIKKMTDASQSSVSTPEDTAKASEGWKKYTCTIDVNYAKTKFETEYPDKSYSPTPFQLGFAGNCDLYIDDIKVTINNGDGTNLMANPGFEGAESTSYDIAGTSLFDADDKAITSISEQGGKEVKAVAYAINNTAEAKTAQIIACLYDGNILIDSQLSYVVNVAPDGEAVQLDATIELPDTIEEDYELRVYLWDSLQGMIPLKRTVDVY